MVFALPFALHFFGDHFYIVSLPRFYSGDENISGENNDVAQYTPDPSEVIVIFPSKLMEISYRVDEEMLVMESTVPLTPPPLPMMKNNNHNNNSTNTRSYHGYNPSRVMSKVMIRYKADEPGNISQQAWCSGAAQVSFTLSKNVQTVYRIYNP